MALLEPEPMDSISPTAYIIKVQFFSLRKGGRTSFFSLKLEGGVSKFCDLGEGEGADLKKMFVKKNPLHLPLRYTKGMQP